MRIVVDFQAVQSLSGLRGIGRYSRSLVRAMIELKSTNEIVLCLNDAFPESIPAIRDEFSPLIGQENLRVWSAPGPTAAGKPNNSRRRLHAELIYEAFLLSQRPDVVLICSLFEGHGDDVVTSIGKISSAVPVAVVLYDLIPLHDPDSFLKPSPSWEQLYAEKLAHLREADLLLAISEFTASDALNRLLLNKNQVQIISAACTSRFQPSTMARYKRLELRHQLGIDRRYLITSGTVEPHKNLITLFRAYAKLPQSLRDTYLIVLIGDFDEGKRILVRNLLNLAGVSESSLIFTGFVPDDDLVVLYSDADLMVFPSIDEGFGLPILEAMACGTPSIGARSSSIPEVVGCEEALFEPLDDSALSQLITRALQDKELRVQLSEHGLDRARRFRWEHVAKSCMSSLEVLASQPSNHMPAREIEDFCIAALRETALNHDEKIEIARAMASNFPEPNRRKRLFVDISQVYQYDVRTGIQRVTRSVLLSWLKSGSHEYDVVPVYATSDVLGYFYAHELASKWEGVKLVSENGPIDYAPGDIFFGLDLGLDIVPFQNSILQKMQRRGVTVLFLVYDLLPVQFPHYFNHDLQILFEPWLETISQSDGIIGISKATVDAFIDWQKGRGFKPKLSFKYDYVHLGADIENSVPTKGMPAGAKSVIQCIQEGLSFLMVGTLEPRKGHLQVLEAFEILWAKGGNVKLVIVGKNGWRVDRLVSAIHKHKELNKRLFWLEAISDEYLQNVYRNCDCLIAASEGEGFGLPLIEAAQVGLPVLARDIPVFREIGGEHVTYFDSTTPDRLASCIENWIADFNAHRLPSIEALKWSTWDECADHMREVVTSSWISAN